MNLFDPRSLKEAVDKLMHSLEGEFNPQYNSKGNEKLNKKIRFLLGKFFEEKGEKGEKNDKLSREEILLMKKIDFLLETIYNNRSLNAPVSPEEALKKARASMEESNLINKNQGNNVKFKKCES